MEEGLASALVGAGTSTYNADENTVKHYYAGSKVPVKKKASKIKRTKDKG